MAPTLLYFGALSATGTRVREFGQESDEDSYRQTETLDEAVQGMQRPGVRVWPDVISARSLPEDAPIWGPTPVISPRACSSGIAVSGGGVRAYVQTLGALRALDDEGGPQNSLLERIRYLTAISGGSWGAASYVYYQMPDAGELPETIENIDNDAQRYAHAKAFDFPPIQPPQQWADGWLSYTGGTYIASFPGRDDGPLKSMNRLSFPSWERNTVPSLKNLAWKYGDEHVWLKWVCSHILAAANIPKDAVMAASEHHADRLRGWLSPIQRNQAFLRSFTGVVNNNTLPATREIPDVIVPGKQMPFLGIVATALGPKSVTPAKYGHANFTAIEFNPLYSGFITTVVRQWLPRDAQDNSKLVTKHIGGAVETVFFGGAVTSALPPHDGGSFSETTMSTDGPWRLSDAVSFSSWAPSARWFRPPLDMMAGAESKALKPFIKAQRLTNFKTVPPLAEEFMFGDGAATGNVPIINLLQRKVKCVAAFWWQVHGKDIEWWKEFVDKQGTVRPALGQLDFDLAALFGVLITDYHKACATEGCNVENNQVFRSEDLVKLIAAWLALHNAGKYLVHRMPLKTKANTYLGVEEYEVMVTFSYASVSQAFIDQVERFQHPVLHFAPTEPNDWMTPFSFESFNTDWKNKYGWPFPGGKTIDGTFRPKSAIDTWMLYQNAGNSVLANMDIYRQLGDPNVCGHH